MRIFVSCCKVNKKRIKNKQKQMKFVCTRVKRAYRGISPKTSFLVCPLLPSVELHFLRRQAPRNSLPSVQMT